MSDYWPLYLRVDRDHAVVVENNPDGRTDQDIWNLVGYQPEMLNLESVYAQYADWVRTPHEENVRLMLLLVIETFETHSYDRLAAKETRPTDMWDAILNPPVHDLSAGDSAHWIPEL